MPRVCRFFWPATLTALLLASCPGPDIEPPVVAIVVPAPSDTVRQVATVKARATDNTRVTAVELLVDGRFRAVDSGGAADTFEFRWDTRVFAPGTAHTLTCAAWDGAGNADTSPAVLVVIDPAAGTHHRGPVTANETWRARDNPHVVDAPLSVDAVLTISPGAAVLFAPGAGITVGAGGRAALRAAGTADSAILFSSAAPDPGPGAWRSLSFRPAAVADSNLLLHCIIEYGGSDSGMLVCESAAVALEACTLRSSAGSGIVLKHGRFSRFRSSQVSACAYFPLLLTPGSVSSLEPFNSLRGNALDAVGVFSGPVAEDAVWPNPAVPYSVLGIVTVAGQFGPVLTLSPACSLLFADSARLRIGVGEPGALVADGASGTITLTGTGSGAWPGIEFWENTRTYQSRIRNCLLERAGLGSSAALFCYQATISVSGTSISGSASGGVYAAGCGFSQFENNSITGCDGYPLRIEARYAGTLGPGNYLADNRPDAIEVAGGTIDQDGEWRDHGVPYLIQGNIEVGSSAAPELVIGSGAELRFSDNSVLRVGLDQPGVLLASGYPDSVTFTAQNPRPGAWRGIEMHLLSSRYCILTRCRILYGGGGGPGIIYINSCRPTLTGCEIGWSNNYCVAMFNTTLDPDSIREQNWLHDWGENFEDIFFEPGTGPDSRRGGTQAARVPGPRPPIPSP